MTKRTSSSVAERQETTTPPGEKSTHIYNPKDCKPGHYLCGKPMSPGARPSVGPIPCPICVSIRKGQLDA